MEDIISKLAEIESAASHIMEDVSEQKKQLAREYEDAVQKFDHSIETEIQKKSDDIRKKLEVEMKRELEKQQSETELTLNKMETYYNECHSQLAKQIYDRILRM